MDRLTYTLNIITNTIVFSHPQRTAMGLVLGYVLHGIAVVFSPFLSNNYPQIDLSKLQELHFLLFGILILHSHILFKKIFSSQSTELDENTMKALTMIENGVNEGHLSKTRAKEMYIEVIQKVINNRQFNQEIKQKIAEQN